MNAETLATGRLAALLRGTAAGMLADTAAADLIIAAGASVTDGQPFAVIRWNAAVWALQNGHLPCSTSERAVLLIAASLAEPGITISLRECLGSLDRRNIALVTAAVAAANG